jgi:chemotaxis protein CheD
MSAEPKGADAAVPPAQVFVMPGTLHCAARPTVMTTILGSCVAICLWDRRRRAGGMNHFVLSKEPKGGESLRYGDVATEHLVKRLTRLGSRIEDLQAKVCGGAAVLAIGDAPSVGDTNVRQALEQLRANGIPVTAQRTGGGLGMMIKFNTVTGEVLVRRIPPGMGLYQDRVPATR